MGELSDRIHNEAAVSARPGQFQRLEAIAEEVERLETQVARRYDSTRSAGMLGRMRDPYRKHWLSDREYEVRGGCIAGPDCPECNPGDLSDAGGRVEP